MADKGLTEKQLIFIREYCKNGFNATQAYLTAGFTDNIDSAKADSCRMLTYANVKQSIKDYLDEVLGAYKDTLEYEIIQMYKLRAFYDVKDILDPKNNLVKPFNELGELTKCIDGIDEKRSRDGAVCYTYKLANRDNALEKLSQYMKLLTQNIDITSKGERLNDNNISEIINIIKERILKDDNK
jgi:hypothetical protein